jgi:hypothetical protein
MKKFSILLVAAIMVLALTMPAAAFENEFGGYWRTRFASQTDYSGTNSPALGAPTTTYALNSKTGVVDATTARTSLNKDQNFVDTRTRIFYTAKFSENLKFVNKFEFNAGWGTNGSYGQLGADNQDRTKNSDGTYSPANNTFRVKASYVDFKLAEQRFTVGVQDFVLARGYIFNDDAAGIKAIFKVNDAIYLPLIYMKMYEGGAGYSSSSNSNSNYDVSAYVFYPTIFLNKDNTLKPHVSYITSENASLAMAKNNYLAASYQNAGNTAVQLPITAIDVWTAGLEYDGKIGIFDLGATGIMQFGTARVNQPPAAGNGASNTDVQACAHGYLFDVFGGVNLGPANIHAKGIYASGMETYDTSGNLNQFFTFGPSTDWGTSYYWAEIMGAGIVDNSVPMGAPGDKINNVYIADLKFAADVWYAHRPSNVPIASNVSAVNGMGQQYSGDLGTELDLVATYTIVDNLKLDLIGAYLWAGDCITKAVDPAGSGNPMELAAQLSLAF